MRNGLLSALSVCALCTGFAHSRQPEPGSLPGGEGRLTPLSTASTPRSAAAESRLAPVAPPLAQLTQPEMNLRSAYPQVSSHPEITMRSLNSTFTPARDPQMFKVQPGEKGNKLPEHAPGRNLSPLSSEPKITSSADVVAPRRLMGEAPQTQPRDR